MVFSPVVTTLRMACFLYGLTISSLVLHIPTTTSVRLAGPLISNIKRAIVDETFPFDYPETYEIAVR